MHYSQIAWEAEVEGSAEHGEVKIAMSCDCTNALLGDKMRLSHKNKVTLRMHAAIVSVLWVQRIKQLKILFYYVLFEIRSIYM